ncbi:MAG TPA: Uma2 family endonuclease [Chroococcidiopsis sp.]
MVTPLPASIQDNVIYPDSDGKPMADNTKQFRWIVVIEQNLDWLFADNPNVFVAGDLLWYPVQGRNTIVTAPDVLVVFGRPKGESPEATLCERGSYQQWREDNIPPQVVFEILSPGNTPREMGRKLLFYDHHGVEEYYIYDPDTDDLEGWLRTDGVLDAIETLDDWISPRLGIRFDRSGDELQIFRPDGQRFLSYIEIGDLLNQTRQQAEAERERAEQAEQQLRAIQEQLAQYRDRFGELPNP